MLKTLCKKGQIASALKFFVLLFAVIFFSSCSEKTGYSEPEDMYIISALGVDIGENGILTTVQTVSKNGAEIFKGQGDSFSSAIENLSGLFARQRDFSHCAVILLGDGLPLPLERDILEYCMTALDVPFSAKVICCHESAELLSLENQSGYDFKSAVRNGAQSAGIFENSTLYENFSSRFFAKSSFQTPYFKVENGEFVVYGLKISTKFGQDFILDKKESAYFLMAKKRFSDGIIYVKNGDKSEKVRCLSAKTAIKGKEEGKTLEISVECRINSDVSKAICALMSKEGQKVISELFARYGDIFDFESELSAEGFDSFGSYENISVEFSVYSKGN